ncbi:MAG: peroxiredoxin [Alphaproteobacteria bacterium]|nr:peroxiredoxin [Alphaproteobacteria bacterium]MDD9919930.1 peroxiredoxin [Alphaproteobacteria bacterium]
MPFMVGQKFPQAQVNAVMPDGSINESFDITEYGNGSHTVVFFYPLDFTFVCPTEIVTFDRLMPEFEARNTKVVSVSVDSHFCHAAWRRTTLNDGGIGEVNFPMVSDLQRDLSDELGILNDAGVTYRASYLLDKDGIVRHMVINDLPLGRNVEEMLRMVDALQFTEQHGEVCPANWKQGETGMKPTRESTGEYLSKAS